MKKINFFFSVAFVLTMTFLVAVPKVSLAQTSPEYDFSNIHNAFRTFLKDDIMNTEGEGSDALLNYYHFTAYATHHLIQELGYEIVHTANYPPYDYVEFPAVYRYVKYNIQGDKLYVLFNGYYFLKKTNPDTGKEGHLIVMVYRDGIMVYSHNSDANLVQEFLTGFNRYEKEKNIFNKSVLEIVKYDEYPFYSVFTFMKNVSDLNSLWEDLILGTALKSTSYDLTEGYLKRMPLMKANGIKTKKGIMLAGPPGTGKSFLGQILGTSILKGELKDKATMIIVTARHLQDISNISLLYDGARIFEPTAIFMEDIDLLGVKNREHQSGSFESESRLNELLNGIDGLVESNYVLTIGTTNKIENVDPAMTRSLRLGHHLYYGLPNHEERMQFFARFGRKHAIWDADVTEAWLAARTEGLSGSDIIEVIRFAKRSSYLADDWVDGKLKLTQAYFLEAIDLLKQEHVSSAAKFSLSQPSKMNKASLEDAFGTALNALRKEEAFYHSNLH